MKLSRNRRRRRSAVLAFFAALLAPVAVRAQEAASRDLAASRLDFERAVAVHDVQLDAGPALLSLDEGLLVPATAVGGRTVEMVFLGRGRFAITPPDAVEAGQLELATGARRLDEEVTEAVFVLGRDVEALLHRPNVAPDALRAERCRQIWESWRQAPERRWLDVDPAVLSIALGLPASRSYFAARLRSADLGEFVYTFDPAAREQVTVGRNAKGFERWISASLRTQDGELQPGQPDFEPQKYTLSLSLADDLGASGVARIDLAPAAQGARLVKLRLAAGLTVSRVTDRAGRELFFTRCQDGFAVFLTEPADVKQAVSLAIEYWGRGGRLIDPLLWFPHTGTTDQALYDVTLRWPKALDLMAGGKWVEGGETEGFRWERRILKQPAANFAFEIGRYHVETLRAGEVPVRFAFEEPGPHDEITGAVVEALTDFADRFGPYPFDELTVVTSARNLSQSPAPGLVVLSRNMTGDLDLMSLLFGQRDRRLVIAREVARQWWGQSVGWAGYREQWLGEAIASHAAARLGKVDVTSGWQALLTASLPNGRMIGTLGPVVLGSRLGADSSDAIYRAIVLKKGAVVFDMLARLVEKHGFAKALRQIAVESAGKSISTGEFLAALQPFTTASLRNFAGEFVYGTVLPEFLYSYRIQAEGGSGSLTMRLLQQMPYRYHYKIVPLERGGFDTVREAAEEIPVRLSILAASYEVEPTQVWIRIRAGADPDRMLLQGASNEYTVDFSPAPARLWIDRKSQVFALFFEEKKNPRRILFAQGLQAAATDRSGEAQGFFDQALALPESPQDVDTARIEIARARLLLDRGRNEEAAAALDRARQSSRDAEALALLQARLDVRLGRHAEAFQALSRILESAGSPNAAEATALFAIAAQALGRSEDFARALRRARNMDVDVEALLR